ncbi:hypothetical protein [Paenibacillus filicis]
MKLRWIYALVVVFIALFSLQMGLFAARQLGGGGPGAAHFTLHGIRSHNRVHAHSGDLANCCTGVFILESA